MPPSRPKPPSMFSMPRPIRQIAACCGEGPGACEGVGAGDNGYASGKPRRELQSSTHKLPERNGNLLFPNRVPVAGIFLIGGREACETGGVSPQFPPSPSSVEGLAKAGEPLLVFDPNSHARLKACRRCLRVEAQAKRVAVMIPNNPLGLPGRKRSERPQFGDDGFGRAIGAVPHHARRFSHRETIEMIFAHIEREPLLARRL